MHDSTRHTLDCFWVIGVNYKKTDAGLRGLFAVNSDQYEQLLNKAPEYGLSDIFILSTCNRTEIYGFAGNAQQLINLLCSVCAGDEATFTELAYIKNAEKATEHLFHVAAGLDSQILGDYEILGQIKASIKQAKAHSAVCPFMDRLINSVLQASKAIKTHTELSGGTVSVSFAAVQYIKGLINSEAVAKKDRKIVLLGTGKIGRITCRNLVDYLDTKNITLINRTEETAQMLAAELGLKSAPIAQMESELAAGDIILISTNATSPVILKDHLAGKGDKLVIDLSVPCNVEKEAQQLPGITFVDVDMLSKIKDETLQKRQAEVPKALGIIEEHMMEFKDWCEMRKHVPVIKEVKNKLKEIYIDSTLLKEIAAVQPEAKDEKIQKVLNSLAAKMRRDHAPGCHYIQAINDFIA
jgi:glutamyl-tRNA reductase